MRLSTHTPISTTTATSSGVSDVHSLIPPASASAFLYTVEGANARATFDQSDPTAGLGSHVLPAALPPVMILLGGAPTVIRFVAATASSCTLNVTWLG